MKCGRWDSNPQVRLPAQALNLVPMPFGYGREVTCRERESNSQLRLRAQGLSLLPIPFGYPGRNWCQPPESNWILLFFKQARGPPTPGWLELGWPPGDSNPEDR